MRKKNKISFGVTEGLDFGSDIEDTVKETISETVVDSTKKVSVRKMEIVEIDPNRSYSPYYTPKPKKGSKGGILGRGAVEESNRKVQFSLTCTPAQKERFIEAAKKDRRKLPDFICVAIEEYIENHGL